MNVEKNTITFEEELALHGSFIFSNVGRSMEPLIRQGRDVMEIHRKPEGRLKKYDVVLYKRGGKYILHRIIKVRKDDYVIVGDHNYRKEYGIKDKDIIGVLKSVIRVENGRRLDVDDWQQRIYAHLWCDLFLIRAGILIGERMFVGCKLKDGSH